MNKAEKAQNNKQGEELGKMIKEITDLVSNEDSSQVFPTTAIVTIVISRKCQNLHSSWPTISIVSADIAYPSIKATPRRVAQVKKSQFSRITAREKLPLQKSL